MKTCSRCKIQKELDEFSPRPSKKDGLDCYCKTCRFEYYKSKRYDRKIYNRGYKRKDIAKRNDYLKEYRKTHKYPKTSKDKEGDRIRKMVKRVLMYTSQHKIQKSKELLGWDKNDFLTRLGPILEGMHIDHKIPVSWFKEGSPVHIINHLDNLQYLPKHINLKKLNTYNDIVNVEYLELCKQHLKEEFLERLKV